MHLFFIDDSRQNNPTRPKLGKMLAAGGVVVPTESVQAVERNLDQICESHGFPEGEIFKWSPGPEHWMRENLVSDHRSRFQSEVLLAVAKHNCRALFVAEDSTCSPAESKSKSAEIDVATLLIERADWFLSKNSSKGMIIVDRTSGDSKQDEAFLANCFETIRLGTSFLKPDNIIMSVVSLPCKLSRLLQVADLVVSATLSYVSGESKFSPTIVEKIKPLFIRESDRVGGVGVKLHPWVKFGNLYHWLFADSVYRRAGGGIPLPWHKIAFKNGPQEY